MFCVRPFISLVVRPATGKQGNNKCPVVILIGTHIAVAGIASKARLAGYNVIIHIKKSIGIAYRIFSAGKTCKTVIVSLCYRKEMLVFNAVGHNNC